jgi:hypothetical protein
MSTKTPFKKKIARIGVIILTFLGTFLIGFLTKLFLGRKPDENDTKQKMDDSVDKVKTDIENAQANVAVLQDKVDKAKASLETGTTEQRLTELAEAGIVTHRRSARRATTEDTKK